MKVFYILAVAASLVSIPKSLQGECQTLCQTEESENRVFVEMQGVRASVKRDSGYFANPQEDDRFACGVSITGLYQYNEKIQMRFGIMTLESNTDESVINKKYAQQVSQNAQTPHYLQYESRYNQLETEFFLARNYSLGRITEISPFLGLHYGRQKSAIRQNDAQELSIEFDGSERILSEANSVFSCKERWLGPIVGVYTSTSFESGFTIHSRFSAKGNLSRIRSIDLENLHMRSRKGKQVGLDALIGAKYSCLIGKNQYDFGTDLFSDYYGDSVLITGLRAGLSICF